MVQRGDRARLALEALAESADAWSYLDRDRAIEPRVARLVDLAHATGADRREDLVGAEPRTSSKHGGRRNHTLRPLTRVALGLPPDDDKNELLAELIRGARFLVAQGRC